MPNRYTKQGRELLRRQLLAETNIDVDSSELPEDQLATESKFHVDWKEFLDKAIETLPGVLLTMALSKDMESTTHPHPEAGVNVDAEISPNDVILEDLAFSPTSSEPNPPTLEKRGGIMEVAPVSDVVFSHSLPGQEVAYINDVAFSNVRETNPVSDIEFSTQ